MPKRNRQRNGIELLAMYKIFFREKLGKVSQRYMMTKIQLIKSTGGSTVLGRGSKMCQYLKSRRSHWAYEKVYSWM